MPSRTPSKQAEIKAVQAHAATLVRKGNSWAYVMSQVRQATEKSLHPRISNITKRFAFDCAVKALPYYEKEMGDTFHGRAVLLAYRDHVLNPSVDDLWQAFLKSWSYAESAFRQVIDLPDYYMATLEFPEMSNKALAYFGLQAINHLAEGHGPETAMYLEMIARYFPESVQRETDEWMADRLMQQCSLKPPKPLEVAQPQVPAAAMSAEVDSASPAYKPVRRSSAEKAREEDNKPAYRVRADVSEAPAPVYKARSKSRYEDDKNEDGPDQRASAEASKVEAPALIHKPRQKSKKEIEREMDNGHAFRM